MKKIAFFLLFFVSIYSFAFSFSKASLVQNGYKITYKKKAKYKPIKIVKDKDKKHFIVVFDTKEDLPLSLYQESNALGLTKSIKIEKIKFEGKSALRIENLKKFYKLEMIIGSDEYKIKFAKSKKIF